MGTLRILGRAGKRCWALGQQWGLREHPERRRRRKLLPWERWRDEVQKACGETSRSSAALERSAAASGEEVAGTCQEIPGRRTRGETDVWAASALPLLAALLSIAYR